MALRPVSELGLVDLTDLASPGKSESSPKARTPRPAGGAKKPQPAARAAKPRAARSEQTKRVIRSSREVTSPAAATPARRTRSATKASRASRAAIVTATWVVAGAGGILLGRAAVRR